MNAMIKWMAGHPVAAALSVLLVLALGFFSASRLPQQTFPDFALDVVSISVAYPGATPSEIQDTIVRPIEEKLSAISEIDEITASVAEGRGGLAVTFANGTDMTLMLDEVKSLVDEIDVFPEEAMDPVVVRPDNRSSVIDIILHGNASEAELYAEAERLRDALARLDGVSFVTVGNTRDEELRIEVSRDALRAYDMTLDEIARAIGQNSLELPAGVIETETASIPVRTAGRNITAEDFANIVIRSGENGAQVRVGDVARVVDGFEDADLSATYSGERAVTINVFQVGDEQVLAISEAVSAYLRNEARPNLPAGLSATVWRDEAVSLESRVQLLLQNAMLGLALVVLCLALFLDLRLAIWSAVSIGVSFAATLIVMSWLGMSINQISLFGFILAIGIVVDNAIVVSEKIYDNGQKRMPPLEAAVKGAQRVAIPVIFSTATTLVAFWPLLQLPGSLGKFLSDVPLVVMTVLALSALQALFILPRNLSRINFAKTRSDNVILIITGAIRRVFDAGLHWFIRRPLDFVLRKTTRGVAIVLPLAISVVLIVNAVGLVAFGYVRFEFFPSIQSESVTARIEMNEGTPLALTESVANAIGIAAQKAGAQVEAAYPGQSSPAVDGVNIVVGQGTGGGGPTGGRAPSSATLAKVEVKLADAAVRTWPNEVFEAAWREEVGRVAGAKNIVISSELIGAGDPVAIELSLTDGDEMRAVVGDLRLALQDIPGLFNISDDYSGGQIDYELALKPEARLYGLTVQDLARQVRAGLSGIEAIRLQRDGADLGVVVQYPESERRSLGDLLDSVVATPAGDRIPLASVADLSESRVATSLFRRDGRQITTVTAGLDTSVASAGMVNAIVADEILPELQARYPDLEVAFGGQQRQQGDAQSALGASLAIALFGIFALLALIFRSFAQPLIVMTAIPLGLVGAITGHYIVGIPLTLLSVFGIIGLAGVVINNSLVMIDVYNENIRNGMPVREAVIEGTKDRFRPILLTSLTTFLGIFPLTLDTSLQAQFLIPLAVSVGYGVLLGMFLIVFSVPSLFMALHGISRLFGLRREQAASRDPFGGFAPGNDDRERMGVQSGRWGLDIAAE
ncbi:MAG: efflux RND transporter permease subunit [Alphaproteobacteria bacterium]|nr:efflux RND transporter permease subunit [Alphaproteobacteria bacterium]